MPVLAGFTQATDGVGDAVPSDSHIYTARLRRFAAASERRGRGAAVMPLSPVAPARPATVPPTPGRTAAPSSSPPPGQHVRFLRTLRYTGKRTKKCRPAARDGCHEAGFGLASLLFLCLMAAHSSHLSQPAPATVRWTRTGRSTGFRPPPSVFPFSRLFGTACAV
jgi:hypothetical protein